MRCVCNLRQRPVWPTGFFFNQTTLGVYSSRDEDWLRTNGRLGQTSPPSPFSSFVSDRPAIYPANIFQLFFHSASSLLFSNHRPTSIVPFIRGKTRHARSFSIVPPAFRFRLPLSLPTHPCPPPVICRENWLRNIFNCPSIFNGGKKKKKKKKIPDRSFLSIIFFFQNFKLSMHIYCIYIESELIKVFNHFIVGYIPGFNTRYGLSFMRAVEEGTREWRENQIKLKARRDLTQTAERNATSRNLLLQTQADINVLTDRDNDKNRLTTFRMYYIIRSCFLQFSMNLINNKKFN